MTPASGSSAGNFLLGQIPQGVNSRLFLQSYRLSAADASSLSAAAQEDTRKYVYNAVASFLAGISAIQARQSSWAVTHMYYSSFYAGRAALSRIGHLIFHAPIEGNQRHTQYEIKVAIGEQSKKVNDLPSTHKLVAHRFRTYGYPPFMRSLTINGSDPLMWLMEQREYWQYRCGRFPDPDYPSILDQIEIAKAQRVLAEYMGDKLGIYISDPSHAIVALPFRLVIWSLNQEPLSCVGVIDTSDLSHLRKRCLVGKQTLTVISKYL